MSIASALQLSFVGPAEWLPNVPVRCVNHVRLKIESGVVFVKPFAVTRDRPLGHRGRDVYEISTRQFGFDFSIVMPMSDPLVRRMHDLLAQHGWNYNRPYLGLGLGPRGWNTLGMEASATAPSPKQPYVSLRPFGAIAEKPPTITEEDVRRVIIESGLVGKETEKANAD